MSEELDYMLISKSNGLNTGLKPNLDLKAAKYESITHRTFLATVEITLPKEIFQRCWSHPNKKISMKPSKTWKNKPCLSPNQKEKINLPHPIRQLQMMYYCPPHKGLWPGTPPKSGCPVWRWKITGWKYEIYAVNSIRTTFETIAPKLLTKYHKTINKRVYFLSPIPDADAFHNVGNNS